MYIYIYTYIHTYIHTYIIDHGLCNRLYVSTKSAEERNNQSSELTRKAAGPERRQQEPGKPPVARDSKLMYSYKYLPPVVPLQWIKWVRQVSIYNRYITFSNYREMGLKNQLTMGHHHVYIAFKYQSLQHFADS